MDTEQVCKWLGIIALACALFLIMFFALAGKPVVRYNLGAQSSGALYINVDIENATDNTISLIGISYERAIAIVDSLNAELLRHPRLK
jgi:hypothetical protein